MPHATLDSPFNAQLIENPTKTSDQKTVPRPWQQRLPRWQAVLRSPGRYTVGNSPLAYYMPASLQYVLQAGENPAAA